MKGSDRGLLVGVLCMIPVVAQASSVPPSPSVGRCLPAIMESLPVIITGQGAALQQATPVAVVIDILPNRTPNEISLKKKNQTINVAVFGRSDFAVGDLASGTVTFGRTGVEAGAMRSPSVRDMNRDGFDDALFGFKTFDCGFELGDFVGILKAFKTDGAPVEGSDSIIVSP